jgi:hypothetical protein
MRYKKGVFTKRVLDRHCIAPDNSRESRITTLKEHGFRTERKPLAVRIGSFTVKDFLAE